MEKKSSKPLAAKSMRLASIFVSPKGHAVLRTDRPMSFGMVREMLRELLDRVDDQILEEKINLAVQRLKGPPDIVVPDAGQISSIGKVKP